MFSDYRVKNWLFMGSPLYVIGISLIYPFVAKVLGPWFMRDRKPFQLQNTLIIYNFVQILFSTWIFSYGWNNGVWSRAVTFQCKPFDYSTSPETLMVSTPMVAIITNIHLLLRKHENVLKNA